MDEEFAKYDLLIAKAQRKGVGSVGGQSIAEFKAELDSLKEQRKEQVAIEAGEAAINAKLNERKIVTEAIVARIREGSLSLPEGMKQLENSFRQGCPTDNQDGAGNPRRREGDGRDGA